MSRYVMNDAHPHRDGRCIKQPNDVFLLPNADEEEEQTGYNRTALCVSQGGHRGGDAVTGLKPLVATSDKTRLDRADRG